MAYSEWKNAGSLVYYLGTGTSFDIKNLFPNDYQNFTVNNFIVRPIGSVSYSSGNTYDNSQNFSCTLECAYTYSEGVLNITKYTGNHTSSSQWRNDSYNVYPSSSGAITVQAKVYLVIGDIETV